MRRNLAIGRELPTSTPVSTKRSDSYHRGPMECREWWSLPVALWPLMACISQKAPKSVFPRGPSRTIRAVLRSHGTLSLNGGSKALASREPTTRPPSCPSHWAPILALASHRHCCRSDYVYIGTLTSSQLSASCQLMVLATE